LTRSSPLPQAHLKKVVSVNTGNSTTAAMESLPEDTGRDVHDHDGVMYQGPRRIPTMKYLVTNPMEKAAIAELGAHYSAMGSTIREALAASKAAFKYEQSILTRQRTAD
jgi:hypothetical protein